MLVDLGAKIVNTDQIRMVERLPSDAHGSLPRVAIVWVSGTREVVEASFEAFENLCGRYIAAAPGFQEIIAWEENGEVGFHDPMPIIAFRVTGTSYYDVTALMLEGEASQFGVGSEMRATIFPDGRCYDHSDGGLPVPLEEWKSSTKNALLKKKLPLKAANRSGARPSSLVWSLQNLP